MRFFTRFRSASTRSTAIVSLVLSAAAVPQVSVMPAPEARLVPNPVGVNSYAGYFCALNGDVAALGAYAWNSSRGRIYVFERAGGGWTQAAILEDPTGAPNDYLGFAVALHGGTLVVGAHGDDHSGLADPGSVFVFERCGGVWTQTAHLVSPAPATTAYFGVSVDTDGQTIVVGAFRDDLPGKVDAGAAYVFVRVDPGTPGNPCDDTWAALPSQLSASVAPNEIQALDEFGRSVSIQGERIAVGAPMDDEPQGDSGSAYVFLRNRHGTQDPTDDTFTEQAKLTAGPTAASAGNLFGFSMDLEGDRLVVGEPFGDQLPLGMGTTNIGAAYVFEYSFGSWFLQSRVTAADIGLNDEFGHAVSLEGDLFAVGAWSNDVSGLSSTDHGAAYLFRRNGSAWDQAARLVAPDARAGDWSGSDVALSGGRLLVGTPYDDVTSAGANNGSGWLYRLSLDQDFELYGFGDPNAVVPCPCGNPSPAGLEQGCENSLTEFGTNVPFGAHLAPAGSDSIGSDALSMWACNLVPNQPALLFAGANRINGGNGIVFGDGIRVAGGSVKRVSVKVPNALGLATWDVVRTDLGVSPGTARHFQVWYRDPIGSPCTIPSGFNLSNGATVTFGP